MLSADAGSVGCSRLGAVRFCTLTDEKEHKECCFHVSVMILKMSALKWIRNKLGIIFIELQLARWCRTHLKVCAWRGQNDFLLKRASFWTMSKILPHFWHLQARSRTSCLKSHFKEEWRSNQGQTNETSLYVTLTLKSQQKSLKKGSERKRVCGRERLCGEQTRLCMYRTELNLFRVKPADLKNVTR